NVDGQSATLPDSFRYVEDVQLFIRGDVDLDGALTLTDAIRTLEFLFRSTDPALVPCADAADSDDNGILDLTDPLRTLGFLYHGLPPLPAPSDTPGQDPTDDELDCERGV
ncbi:MAG TPA: hypothetical protein VK116_02450, partial [Planctomycetota bacterium]|nr:hypothetical protein [Planctomycetota bacterium]